MASLLAASKQPTVVTCGDSLEKNIYTKAKHSDIVSDTELQNNKIINCSLFYILKDENILPLLFTV